MLKTHKSPGAAPKSFREIRYEEKKDAIIMSASRAFGKKGFDSTTIEEIANESKMTKGSLYYYFKTKEELLYEAHLLSLKAVIKRITEINETPDPSEFKFRRAVTEHLKILANDFEGAFLLQQEYALPEHYKKEVIALRDLYEAQFIRILQEGIRAKRFSVKDAKVASFCMLGAINWFLRWYSSKERLSVEEIADAFVDFFFHGLLGKQNMSQGELHGHQRGAGRGKNHS